ncbi:helix-turn-helix domain-containing protein [Actinokineospora sp.]|uniref:helix-turn-helix domain-containing protein n=1 Tax=Actinokineospora sp. TaxID=1872133 RepID=UPI0040376D56
MAESRADGGQGRPTARRIVLGSQLRRLREKLEISRADAGWQIRGSDSKISRMELGRVSFKERDVADLLTMYGVIDQDEREQFFDMVKDANEPGWWHRYKEMPNWLQDFVGLEESASRIQTCELQFVPGLMQTEEYMKVLAAHGRPDMADEVTERRVSLRMARQKLLHRTDSPKLWAVIDESVLHRPIGGPRVLRRQIEHLLELIRLPNITLQVVPFGMSGYAAEGSFTMLRFIEGELPDIVFIEHLSGALYLDRVDEIEQYSRVLDRLSVDAETPSGSRQMLMKRLAEI